jgi:hypothetical protein
MATRCRPSQVAAALALAALAVAGARPAAAASTAFKVRLQPVTLLYYFSAIDLTLDSAALAKLATPAAGTALPAKALTATAAGQTLTANAALVPKAANRMNAVQLTISNAWAVRSIGSARGGRTTVSARFSSGARATLSGPAGSGAVITLSNLGVNPNRFAPTGLDPAKARQGALRMRLDLSRARSAGSYGTATIVITATTT